MAKIFVRSTTIRPTAIRTPTRATICRKSSAIRTARPCRRRRRSISSRGSCWAASRASSACENSSKRRVMNWSSRRTRTGPTALRARAGRRRRRHLAAVLAGLSDRRTDRQGEEPQAGDHRRHRIRSCRPAGRDRPRNHRRRSHLLQLDQRRRACGDDDPVAGAQLSAVVGGGEGRRLEHRRLRRALLRCRGDACRHGRRGADRLGGAAAAEAVRHASALYRPPSACRRRSSRSLA